MLPSPESETPRRMPARKHYEGEWDIMRLRLPPGTFARIQNALKKPETKTELIRAAIERELLRREAESKKKPGQK
jgi:hypothetical protein